MKRTWTVLLVLLMLVSMTAVAYAETSVVVNVTLADQGQLAVVGQAVTVTDEDGDSVLTINDALIALHTAKGKEYATANTEWGLSITKLWGNTGGNFGYWVNNASAWSLTDPVAEGDSVYAFIYKDGDTFSDQYCYFDQTAVAVKDNEAFTLTLTGMVYDMASWTYQPAPLAGAVITVDGEKTAYVTDAEGKVTLKVEKAGEHLISAVSESGVLVPPACTATVTATKVNVAVSLADQGNLVCNREELTVTDADGDEALTINDALIALHTAKGKEYATANTEWGLSITKLWGNTGGNFGYWVNNASAWSLTDPVAEGDFVYAFIYKDGDTFSDQYCYFDQTAVAVKDDEAFTLTLTGMVYDAASWTYQPAPLAGAVITVDGEKTAYVTDAEGKVTLKVEEAGEHLISAVSESGVLVPPACVAKVTASARPTPPPANDSNPPLPEQPQPPQDQSSEEKGEQNPDTGDNSALFIVLAVISLGGMAVLALYGRKLYED